MPLPVRSFYSLGRGTAAPAAIVQHASQLGYRCLVLADVENLYGQVQFHAACHALGIRPVTGVELRDDVGQEHGSPERHTRVVLLARTVRGYSALCRVVTARRGSTVGLLASLGCVEALATDAFVLTDDVAIPGASTWAPSPASWARRGMWPCTPAASRWAATC